MIRWNRILIACAATLLVAACGDSPSSPVGPELDARRSGGYSVGANDMAGDTTYTVQSTGEGQVLSDGASEGENRGGGYSVGGN